MTLNEWEQSNIEVLTSREMGEWLGRRENRLLDKIKAEIEAIQQDVLKSSETPLDSAYNISIGISMALGVIKKYTKGEQE